MTIQIILIAGTWLVAAAALAMLLLVWERGHARRKPVLALLLLASALYAFGYGLELAGDSVAWVLSTFYLQHLAIAFAPLLVLLLAADVGRAPALASWPVVGVVAGVAVATVAIVYTNTRHDLYHVAPRMVEAGPLTLIAFDRGPWYLVYHAVMAAALVAATVVLVRGWWRAPRGSSVRVQALIVALAVLIPWLASVVYLLELLPWPIDTTPYGLVAFAILVYVGVNRHALADVSPIARALVFERMQDPVLVLDDEDRLVDYNAAAAAILRETAIRPWHGRPFADLLGHAVIARPEQDERDTVIDVEPFAIAGHSYDARSAQVRGAGTDPLGRVVVLRDVSDHLRLQRMLTQLANTDELTGIANRRSVLELTERVLHRASRSSEAVSFVIFDLDRFKAVNDEYGHVTGDHLLRAIAKSVARGLRPTDIFGRYGGEEFALCLPDAGAEAAQGVSDRLRAAVAATSVATTSDDDRFRVGVSASIGVCVVEAGATADLEAVLACADDAQYEAKRQGGDRVVVFRLGRHGRDGGPPRDHPVAP